MLWIKVTYLQSGKNEQAYYVKSKLAKFKANQQYTDTHSHTLSVTYMNHTNSNKRSNHVVGKCSRKRSIYTIVNEHVIQKENALAYGKSNTTNKRWQMKNVKDWLLTTLQHTRLANYLEKNEIVVPERTNEWLRWTKPNKIKRLQ